MSSHQSTYILPSTGERAIILPTTAATFLAVSWLILSNTNCKYFKILCIFKSGTDKIYLCPDFRQNLTTLNSFVASTHFFHNSEENPSTTNLSKLFQTCNYTIPQNQQTRDHHLDIQLLKNL